MSDIFDGHICAGISRRDNFSFASATTYGSGGVAKAAFFPRSEDEAAFIYRAMRAGGEKFCVLGRGSNVLAQDGIYNGYVISTSQLKSPVRIVDSDGKRVVLEVSCGLNVGELISFCKREGLTGLEYLAGIPASVGGLLFMNGGADGKYIGENVCSVKLLSDNLEIFSDKDCNFTYKHSTMRDMDCMIVSAKLAVRRSDRHTVSENVVNRLAARRQLPAGRSCGCVFENYCGVSAGKIIENAGLKGARVGCAYVSPKHANFIINRGRRSSDVYTLICRVKDEVYKKFGVTLKEEVCYIGDFE